MKSEVGIKKRIAELMIDLKFWENKYKESRNAPANVRREAEYKFHVLCARVAELAWVMGDEKKGKVKK